MDAVEDWPTGRLLSAAARSVEQAWAVRLEAAGLTHAGLVALHALAEGPRSQTELARAARVQLQTMARTLERAERQGHVLRERDEVDARRVLVSITPAGRSALRSAGSLEADVFPAVDDPGALRAALLQILRAR